ncbi:MAG TPA: hypothetical protein VGH56_13230, partial [Solirubrobacteraceae bacterium]
PVSGLESLQRFAAAPTGVGPRPVVDEGGLPYRWRHSCIALRTQSRVRVGAIAPGWQSLQNS